MKWFRHHSDLCRDEDVRTYFDKAGNDRLNAYGFLMLVLEAICERMANPNTGDYGCSVRYSDKEWARVLGCHVNRVKKYMGLLPHISWVTVEFEEGNYRVRAAKLLDWRDEYSRKSGAGPDKVAQRRTDKNRIDKREIEALSDEGLTKASSRTPPTDFVVTDELRHWASEEFPDVDIESETKKFLLYTFQTPRDNWENEWKLWIHRADERMKQNPSMRQEQKESSQWLKLGEELRIERRKDESEREYIDRVVEANDARLAKLEA